jgi:hypothetical protein
MAAAGELTAIDAGNPKMVPLDNGRAAIISAGGFAIA